MKTLTLKEPEVGEIFEHGGQTVKCVKKDTDGNCCKKCAFINDACLKIFACSSALRQDGLSVYFVNVK